MEAYKNEIGRKAGEKMAENETKDGLGVAASGKITFVDLLMAGGVKYFEERLLTPYIGNGTLISGAVKIAAAKYVGKSLPKPVKLALAIDGAEDIVAGIFNGSAGNLLGGVLGGAGSASQQQAELI